jgi:proline iminopeptidase
MAHLTCSRKLGVPTGLDPSSTVPHLWLIREEYLAPIPEAERGDLILAYHAQLNSTDDETRLRAARAWSKWE